MEVYLKNEGEEVNIIGVSSLSTNSTKVIIRDSAHNVICELNVSNDGKSVKLTSNVAMVITGSFNNIKE